MKESKYIWKNGDLIDWENATTHVLTHALHYGTAVFEGVRAYKTPKGPAIFRAQEHFDRLINSAKIYQFKSPYTATELLESTKDLINRNRLDSCYIRPAIYVGYKEMGLSPKGNPIDALIAAWEWGTYLGEEGLEKGIRCKISSWTRLDSRILPPLAKSSANYANSVLAKNEALDEGYDEAILLNTNGHVSEGPGENIFVIKNGKVYTPQISDNALDGITRQSIIEILQDLNIPIIEKSLIRDELFLADELFFTGTAAEVTPIREINGRIIGEGKRGLITEQVQKTFFDAAHGKIEKYSKWLTHC